MRIQQRLQVLLVCGDQARLLIERHACLAPQFVEVKFDALSRFFDGVIQCGVQSFDFFSQLRQHFGNLLLVALEILRSDPVTDCFSILWRKSCDPAHTSSASSSYFRRSLPAFASIRVKPARGRTTGMRPSSCRYTTSACAKYAISVGPAIEATVGNK